VNRRSIENVPARSLASPSAGALLCAIFLGCGGMPPPNDQLVASQASIRAAEEVGGNTDPQAELHLKLAREQLDKAKALMQDDENEAAMRLLQRAEADAELSLALARKRAAQAAAEEELKQVQRLKGGAK
jgi:hypothetical protein